MPKALRTRPVAVEIPPWGVLVFESHHGPDFAAAPYRNSFWKILYVLDGRGRCVFERSDHPFGAGDVFLVPANVWHKIEDDAAEPLSLLVVCIDAKLVDAYARRTSPARISGDALFSQEARQIIRRMLMEQTRRSAGFELLMRGLAMELLVASIRATESAVKEDSDRISGVHAMRQFLSQMDSRLHDVGGIDEVARQVGLSRRRFTELCRKLTGRSWKEHLRELRMNHARHLLASTTRSATAIAFECGFEDVSTFYRAFRAVERCTPLEYRAKRKRQ